ncbi:MAG: ribonuclease P protein component [Chloroflexi bacterium]|nr:ribonuclease P protein component [Chloroflexota bacterium]
MDRRHRVRRADEIRRVRQQGRCWSSDVVTLCALPTGAATTRFAVVVSKRQGGAVTRNRIKRRMREAARTLAPSLPAGYDIVMMARGPIATRTSHELGVTLADLVRRARLQAAPARTRERSQPG